MPLRERVVAAFLLLITLGIIESVLVLYVQREGERARADAERAELILERADEIGRTLSAMQAAQRGFLLTRLESQLEEYEMLLEEYQRLASGMPRLLEDQRHQNEFQHVRELIEDWRVNAADVLVSRARRGQDVTREAVGLAVPRFARAREALDAFVTRQRQVAQAAGDTATRRARRVTVVLTIAPLVGTLVTVLLMLSANRGILRAQAVAAAHRETLIARDDLLAIINTVPAALFILNRDLSLRLSNRAAEQILGTPPPGMNAADYWRTFEYRDRTGNAIALEDLPAVRAFNGDEVPGEEVQMLVPGKPPMTILISAAPLRDEEGRVTAVAAGFLDTTRLRELDRMKEEFVSVVSHELRTPLTAILGSLQLLLADTTAVPDPENRQLLDVALNSCQRLVRIVNDILDVSKIEAGRLNLRPRSVAVDDIVQQSIEVVLQIAAQAGVRFATDVAAGLPPVLADPDRLTQALVNLLSNAVKFAPADSVVTITAREEGECVAIAVRDEGAGIAPEDLSRLFGKFEQLDRPGVRRAGGTGLGLAITKGIIEQHGGRITVESGVGRGATFTMMIPKA